MPITPQPELRTARLVLRPFRLTDARDVQRLAGEFAVADTTLNIPHPYQDGMAEAWIASHGEAYARDLAIPFAITRGDTGEFLGCISLRLELPQARAELGYWIGVPYWGQGFMTEATKAVLAYSFDTLGLHRVHASHLTRNPASGRVMQNAGMLFEGVLRGHAIKHERFEDIARYGVLRTDPRVA